jgi:hypothetical protein
VDGILVSALVVVGSIDGIIHEAGRVSREGDGCKKNKKTIMGTKAIAFDNNCKHFLIACAGRFCDLFIPTQPQPIADSPANSRNSAHPFPLD